MVGIRRDVQHTARLRELWKIQDFAMDYNMSRCFLHYNMSSVFGLLLFLRDRFNQIFK